MLPLFHSEDGLRELTRAPLLSPEEEGRIAREIDEARRLGHDEALTRAAGRLALHNTRLAVSIAKRYVNRGLPLADLVQEAMLGLLKAAKRFEPRRGTRFSTAATWWIRQAVVLALQERGRLVRVPGRALLTLGRVRKVRSALEQELGREPSVEEIAAASGIGERKAKLLVQHLGAPRSIDAALAEGLGAEEAVEGFPDDLRAAMEPLSEREREILSGRFGLSTREPDTLEDIGRRLGVTRERVRQIERRALDKLRSGLRKRGYA